MSSYQYYYYRLVVLWVCSGLRINLSLISLFETHHTHGRDGTGRQGLGAINTGPCAGGLCSAKMQTYTTMEQHDVVVMPDCESHACPSPGSEGSYTLPMPLSYENEEYGDGGGEWEGEDDNDYGEEEGDYQTVSYFADLSVCLADFSDASDTNSDTPTSLVCAICDPCRQIRIAFDGCTHAACRTCTLRLCWSRWERGKSPPAWFPCPFCRTEVRRVCDLGWSEGGDDDGWCSWETVERGGVEFVVGGWLGVEMWVADQYEKARMVIEEFEALEGEFSGGGDSWSDGGGGWVGGGSWSGDGSWTGGSSPPELGSP